MELLVVDRVFINVSAVSPAPIQAHAIAAAKRNPLLSLSIFYKMGLSWRFASKEISIIKFKNGYEFKHRRSIR